jgi:hypothetical protein
MYESCDSSSNDSYSKAYKTQPPRTKSKIKIPMSLSESEEE